MDKLVLKFMWKSKGPSIAKITLKMNNKVGGIILHNSKTYYKRILIKTAWHWHKDAHIDQWNTIESPEIN